MEKIYLKIKKQIKNVGTSLIFENKLEIKTKKYKKDLKKQKKCSINIYSGNNIYKREGFFYVEK